MRQLALTVKKSTLHDICEISNRVRPEHVSEIMAMSGRTPEKSLMLGYLTSEECYTASLYIGARWVPVHMFGTIRKDDDRAMIWALGSPEVDRVPRQFTGYSIDFISYFLNKYKVLYNWVDARYKTGIRYLEYFGAYIEEAKPRGEEGRPFHYFEIRRGK